MDAVKVKIIRSMKVKKNQKWVLWLERKEKRLMRRWKTNDVYGYRPNRKQKEELRKDCIFEYALGVWYEIGGTTRELWWEKREKERLAKESKEDEEFGREVRKIVERERESKRLGECLTELLEKKREKDRERLRSKKRRRRREEKRKKEGEEKGELEMGVEVKGDWKSLDKMSTKRR